MIISSWVDHKYLDSRYMRTLKLVLDVRDPPLPRGSSFGPCHDHPPLLTLNGPKSMQHAPRKRKGGRRKRKRKGRKEKEKKKKTKKGRKGEEKEREGTRAGKSRGGKN